MPEDVGFGQDVEKKLRSRKKIEGQTEWDKWVHMFRILFPSFRDKATPSPCEKRYLSAYMDGNTC